MNVRKKHKYACVLRKKELSESRMRITKVGGAQI